MIKDGFVAVFRKPFDGRFEPLGMVWKIGVVERPEILLVGEDVHNFRTVGVFGERFKDRDYLIDLDVVTNDVGF